MDLLKYDMTDIWAVAGDVVAPDSAKIRAGWGVEVVPRQWWNWFENRQDQNIAYLLQKGIPEWDATTEYIINKSYVQRNGTVYRATATSTNSDPVALTSWVKAFPNSTAASEALSAVTPAANTMPYFTSASAASTTALTAFGRSIAALVDAAAARTLFNAQLADSNLTALSGVTANTNILPYFTSTTAMTGTTLTAFARTLLDDGDAATMRATLGLGTAAVGTVTTSTLDNTVGRITRVGDFGESGGDPIQLANTIDAGGLTVSGTYVFPNGGPNLPTVSSYYLKHTSYPQVGYAKQVAQNVATNTQYMRSQVGGLWSAWTTVWTTDNLVITTSANDATVGRITKVGDFGLGKDAVVITNPDAVYRATGFYDVDNALTWASRPIPGYTRIFHQSHANANGYATQYCTADFANSYHRYFNRQCINGVWSGWVELYHTGNSAALVSQVTAGIQPTLDAKVNRAGDIMTGQLGATSFYAVPSAGQGGQIYLKANGSTAPGGVDATINIDSPTASTNNGGRMIITAATTYLQSALTVTGVANFQGAINASGTITGANFSTAGTVTALGVSSGANGLVSSGGLTVTGVANIAAGICRMNTGGFAVLPTSGVSANACVYSFYDISGTVLRGAIYGTSVNQVVIQTGTGQSAYVADSSGNSSLKAIACNSLNGSGRVSSSQDLLSATHVYLLNGAAYVDSTANPYGSVWGGYLSTFLANTYTQRGNIGADMAAVNVQGIGVYAFLQNQNVAMGIGALAAGGLLYSSHNQPSGTVAPGTWRCMGFANTGGCAVFQRVA